jgi:hypothetical protein
MHWTIKIRDRFAPDFEINPRYRAHLEELRDQFKIMEKGHKSEKYETTPLDRVNDHLKLIREMEQINEMFSLENMLKRMHLLREREHRRLLQQNAETDSGYSEDEK